MKYKRRLIALVAGILCCPFLSFGTYEDLMKSRLKETPEQEQIRLQQEEARKVNLLKGWDDHSADDLLFVEPAPHEDPEVFARNTLHAYYLKELGVDSLPEAAFKQFIQEDFGKDVSYHTALESLRRSKRWGTEARDPTPQELEQHRMTRWELLWSGGVPAFNLVGLFAFFATAIAIFLKIAENNVNPESKLEEKEVKMLDQCPTPKRTLGIFKNLNNGQKTALLISVGLCCLILSLHNPFGGYETGYGRSFFEFKSSNCSVKAIDEIGEMSGMMMPLLAFGGFVVFFLRSNKNKPQQ